MPRSSRPKVAGAVAQALRHAPPDPRDQSPNTDRVQQEERRRQLLKLLAEIEKRINEENSRPKKRYISPATREEVYAVYYDALRRKIEDKGTESFPEQAGRKLYGELTMIVTVNHDGRVLDTETSRVRATACWTSARRPSCARQVPSATSAPRCAPRRPDRRGVALQVHARADAGDQRALTPPPARFPDDFSSLCRHDDDIRPGRVLRDGPSRGAQPLAVDPCTLRRTHRPADRLHAAAGAARWLRPGSGCARWADRHAGDRRGPVRRGC